MRIGVVSDTHGRVDTTRLAVKLFSQLEVEAVLHCGDIGTPAVVELFDGLPAHFVFGNVDDPAVLEPAIRAAGQTCHGRFGGLELAGRRIALLHGDDGRRFREAVKGGEWDMVCYGHTHAAKREVEGKTVVLNPGAICRASTHTVAIVELPSLATTMLTV